jgi:hypothetical protein
MKNQDLTTGLRVAGGIAAVVGVIVGIMLIAQFSKAGAFSKAELKLGELATAAYALLGHVAFGLLCFGVAQGLAEIDSLRECVNKIGSVGEQPTPAPAKTTKCTKCGKTYKGDLQGQFCEGCGQKL